MISTPLDKILFMDIETVGCDATYKKLQKSNKALAFQFNNYLDYFQKKYSEEANSTVDQLFVNKAALTPEFAKIVCISFAFMVGGEVRVQSFSGEDEKTVLEGAKDIMDRVHSKGYTLCGHNIKGFAFGNQGANGFEHQTVIVTIEICGADCVGDLIPCGGIEKQTAQDGLLCFDRVRRHAQRIDLIDRALSESLGTGHCVRSAYRYPCC